MTRINHDDVGVIVPAAGRGVRMRARRPKAFLPLGGAPLALHALRALGRLRPAAMVLALPADALPRLVRRWGRALRRAGVTAVVPGGARRQDSVAAGLAALGPACRWVLIHDAARPLVPTALAAAVVRAARRTGAAIAATPCVDTLKRVGGAFRLRQGYGGQVRSRHRGTSRAEARSHTRLFVERTLPREHVWCVQTPQVFRRDLLDRAFARAGRRSVTDEAGLVESLGTRIAVVPGSLRNLKVTTPEDLAAVRAFAVSCCGRRR